MNERLHILLIDDDEDEYFFLKELVAKHKSGRTFQHYQLDWIPTYQEAVTALSGCQHDLLLVDYHLGAHTGLDLLREAAAQKCSVPIIMLTGQGDYKTDIAAMELGAADYLEKGQLTLPLFERSIRYAVERARTLAELQKQAQEIDTLQKATSSLLSTLDLSRLMGQILDAAQEAIPAADRSWLHIIEQSDARFAYLNTMNFTDARVHKVKIEGLPGKSLSAVLDGRSLIVPEMRLEPQFLSLLQSSETPQAVDSAIIAPLMMLTNVFGTLSLMSSALSAFSEEDLSLLTSFAATASAAIHNAVLYAETQKLATHDPLTGKLNRRSLFEHGQREVDRFQRFGHHLSALMFDVDHFKEVNDQLGHATGDKVLATIAERCSKVIRNVDVLGRYGGDEFAVLLPEADAETAQEIAERLRDVLKSPIITESGPVSVSISVGAAQADAGTTQFTTLLEKADEALYQSKQAGRNRTTLAM